MRLRVITKDGKFVDYDVDLPIYLSASNLKDKFAVMIVEEKRKKQ